MDKLLCCRLKHINILIFLINSKRSIYTGKLLCCRLKYINILAYAEQTSFLQSKAYSRVVTPLQFGRILHFLGMNVAPEDLKLLLTKFQDPATGDVNYPAFVQAVDQGQGHTCQGLGVREGRGEAKISNNHNGGRGDFCEEVGERKLLVIKVGLMPMVISDEELPASNDLG